MKDKGRDLASLMAGMGSARQTGWQVSYKANGGTTQKSYALSEYGLMMSRLEGGERISPIYSGLLATGIYDAEEDWDVQQQNLLPPSLPSPPTSCPSLIIENWQRLKIFFDDIWQKTLDSKNNENPGGVEKGAVIPIRPTELNSTWQEILDVEHFPGPDRDWGSMVSEFNDWAIEIKRQNGLKGWISLTVHTHPALNEKGETMSEDILKKPPVGDFRNAPSGSVDAIITPSKIILFNGKGTYNKKDWIKCEIDRETGISRKIN